MSSPGPEPGVPRPLGQDRILAEVLASIAAGRCHHALLLSGPEGIGKALAARLLGMTFLCPRRNAAGPCGRCRACRRFLAGGHPDWHCLEPSGEGPGLAIPIAEARKLESRLRLAPGDGVGRVAFIEEATRLQEVGQNTLLKTLEEPPPATLFLLTALRPSDLLPTVVSRCQVLRLEPLTPDQVEQVAAAAGTWPREELALAVAMAEGSPGRALRFLAGGGRELLEPARELLRPPGRGWDPVARSRQVLEPPPDEAGTAGGVTAGRRRRALFFLGLVRQEAARHGRERLLAGEDQNEYHREFTRRMLELCTEAERDIQANLDPTLVLEVLMIRAARRAPRRSAGSGPTPR